MSNIFQFPRVQSLPGAKIYFYATGTTTPQNTYTDADLSIAHSNPVEADANGYFAPIYLDPTLPDYRMKLTTSADVLIVQYDDVPAVSAQSLTYRIKGASPQIIFEETDASTNNKIWRMRVNGEVFTISTGNDAESSFTDILSLSRSDIWSLSGSFTATLTGFTGAVTGTVNYQRSGDIVMMCAPSAITGTSNTTALTLSGIPSGLRPASSVSELTTVRDAGNSGRIALSTVASDGTVTFELYSSITASPSSTGFTNSGSKGLQAGWVMKYLVV